MDLAFKIAKESLYQYRKNTRSYPQKAEGLHYLLYDNFEKSLKKGATNKMCDQFAPEWKKLRSAD
ncbi:hypothetical protein JCM39068_40960 [Desulfocastanea catecholica]